MELSRLVSVVVVTILILFVLDRGLNRGLAWTGLYMAHEAQWVHRGWLRSAEGSSSTVPRRP
jgi:hypothetical protein